VSITASIGIMVGRGALHVAADVLRGADIAMYEAKAAGKGCLRVFRHGMKSSIVERLEMAADLRGAVERGELSLEYQPLVDLRTQTIRGFESLVRWRHPVRGQVAPDQFIPVAEETGLIVDLGQWIFREACRQLAEWRRTTLWGQGISLSVNVSPRQLRERDFVDSLRTVMAEMGVPASQITCEVTERAVVEDLEEARGSLASLRELGIRTAVDDFGSGYSSIGYLSTLPLDEIKIDRMFIGKLGKGESKDLVVALVRLVDTLSVTTVVEGVETSEDLAYACALGIDVGQGYYFSRPVGPSAVAQLMTESILRGVTPNPSTGIAHTQVA
jgi:EAL domain-containing protein (putative c-di-GMP-specific phosphodiesterase class I)